MKALYFNELATKLATTFSHVTCITPQEYTGANGKTYYYLLYHAHGADLPSQTQPYPTPLGAYRYARKAMLFHPVLAPLDVH